VTSAMRSQRGVVVLGLDSAAGDLRVGPASDTILRMGDRVILMGQESELEAIRPVRPS